MISADNGQAPAARLRRSRRHGPGAAFTLLELVVTTIIVAIVVTAVLMVADDVLEKSVTLESRLEQERILEHCIDLLAEDLATAGENGRIAVASEYYGDQEMSHVKVGSGGMDADNWSLEWVSAPRYEQEDLVLFRRRQLPDEEGDFVPMCDNLHLFVVQLYDAEGQTFNDPNQPMQMVEVLAEAYMDETHNPERVVRVRRTFCRNRF